MPLWFSYPFGFVLVIAGHRELIFTIALHCLICAGRCRMRNVAISIFLLGGTATHVAVRIGIVSGILLISVANKGRASTALIFARSLKRGERGGNTAPQYVSLARTLPRGISRMRSISRINDRILSRALHPSALRRHGRRK